MAELVTLTAPIAKPNQTTVRITGLSVDVENKVVTVSWIGNNNNALESGQAVYPTPAPTDHPSQPTGAVLLNTLNNANMATTSFVKRCLQRLQADGYIPAGTIGGTPD